VGENPLSIYVHKYMKLYGNFMREVQSRHAGAFLPHLPSYLEFCYSQLEAPLKGKSGNERVGERVAIHCLLFLNSVLMSLFYRQGEGDGVIRSFFDVTRVNHLFELLLVRYLRLKKSDLEEWEADPESFFIGAQITDLSEIKMNVRMARVL